MLFRRLFCPFAFNECCSSIAISAHNFTLKLLLTEPFVISLQDSEIGNLLSSNLWTELLDWRFFLAISYLLQIYFTWFTIFCVIFSNILAGLLCIQISISSSFNNVIRSDMLEKELQKKSDSGPWCLELLSWQFHFLAFSLPIDFWILMKFEFELRVLAYKQNQNDHHLSSGRRLS